MDRAVATTREESSPEPAAAPKGPWLVRHPLGATAMALVALQLLIRTTIIGDAYFVTDDFMLTTRALESDLGWDYLTRVHTGHFEPIPFLLYWLLAHVAPLSWPPVVALSVAGQLVLNVAMYRLLRLLFGARPLILVPYAVFLFAALTLPSFLWFAASVITLPLQISLTLALYWHVKYTRDRKIRYALAATAALIFGLLCFEKAVLFVPFVFVFTASYWPARNWLLGFIQATRRLWPIWLMYAAVIISYLAVYLSRAREADATSRLFLPSVQALWDFAYYSVFRAFIPGVLGGPWHWWSIGHGGALADSPRILEWLTWAVALGTVLVTVALRRRAGRAWIALLVYLLGSIASLGFTRVPLIGSVLGLQTRYVADAIVPLTVVLGLSLMPMIGEKNPWHVSEPLTRWLAANRGRLMSALAAATAVVVASSLWSGWQFADIATSDPSRQYVTNARASLKTLPKGAEIYDGPLINDGIIGSLFAEYNNSSRFLAPLVDAKTKREMYSRRTYTKPYLLDNQGRLRPMVVVGAESSPGPLIGCGWKIDNPRGRVPLRSSVFDYAWAMRIGYIASDDTDIFVGFGDAVVPVHLQRGLNQIVFPVVAGGESVLFFGVPKSVTICVGDIQIGNPVALP